jgi:hypothetical protein
MWRSYGDAEIPIEESSRKGKPPPTSGVVFVGEIAVGETAPLLTPPHRTESASMIAALALTLAALPAAPAAIQSSSNQSSPTQASLGGLSVTPFAPTMQANLVGARMLNVRLNLPTQAWQEEFILAIPSTVAWPAPVLTLFHGYGEEPDDVVANSPLVGEAMARGFVVFIPLGAHKYNYGIDYAQRNIELAFEFLSARLPIDLDRIYAAGFSMGGGASDARRDRWAHSFFGVGGSASSGRAAMRCTTSSGRSPNASWTRRAVPKRLVTAGNAAPRGRLNRIAGPPAAMTRRWTSAISSRGSTSASTSTSSPSALRRSRKAGRSRGAE